MGDRPCAALGWIGGRHLDPALIRSPPQRAECQPSGHQTEAQDQHEARGQETPQTGERTFSDRKIGFLNSN